MRRFLFGVCAAALLAGAAEAQIVCANCTNEMTEVLREAARVQQVAQEILTLRNQLVQLEQTYSAIAHLPDNVLQNLSSTFNVDQFRNPIGSSSQAIGSIINGTGLGGLTALGQQFLDMNRVFTPTGTDFNANALASNAASIAGVQSLASQLFTSAASHNAALQSLEGQLKNAPDEKAVADISARVALEHTYIAGQQVQAQAISTWQASQVRNTQQQREESRRCYIHSVLVAIENGDQSPPNDGACAQAADSSNAPQTNPDGSVSTTGTSGASVATGYDQFTGQSVGSGQCVALVQAADSNVGLTRTWTQGAQVMGNTDLQPGTAIATFDGSGKYANATDGSSHAAIYLGQNADGMQVEDQWLGHAASVRTIPWSGAKQANSGGAFYVIAH